MLFTALLRDASRKGTEAAESVMAADYLITTAADTNISILS